MVWLSWHGTYQQNMVGKVDIHKSAEIFEKQVVYAAQNITKTVNNRKSWF